MFCFVFPFLFCCRVVVVVFGVAVLSYPGPSTQQYLKIQIRPPAIGSVVMVNGDSSHIFSLPLTPPPPPTLPSSHQPLFTSFGYNMPTCSTFGYEPASSCSEEPQKETGINTHMHVQPSHSVHDTRLSFLTLWAQWRCRMECESERVWENWVKHTHVGKANISYSSQNRKNEYKVFISRSLWFWAFCHYFHDNYVVISYCCNENLMIVTIKHNEGQTQTLR